MGRPGGPNPRERGRWPELSCPQEARRGEDGGEDGWVKFCSSFLERKEELDTKSGVKDRNANKSGCQACGKLETRYQISTKRQRE